MELRPLRDAFDGGDGLSFQLHREQQAAELRFAADEHRAGAAFAELASVLGAGELQVLAQDLQQRLVHRHQELFLFAVDLQCQHDALDLAQHFVLHVESSIFLSVTAHAQRSGATACARL